MSYELRELGRVRTALLLASAAGWSLLLTQSEMSHAAAHGAMPSHHAVPPLPGLAANWVVMFIAMMSPVMILPVHHVRLSSFRQRRARSVALFVMAYAAVWMAVGAALTVVAFGLTSARTGSAAPALAAAFVALVWQCTPFKQRCLNRCHAHPELPAFDRSADAGAVRFGAVHGLWCAGSCWALMLVPLLLPSAHVAAMAAGTLLIVAERFERPGVPRWTVRVPGKALRFAVVQTRIRLHAAGALAR